MAEEKTLLNTRDVAKFLNINEKMVFPKQSKTDNDEKE